MWFTKRAPPKPAPDSIISSYTEVPGREPIKLPAAYAYFDWYYPRCEMSTKQWFVDNVQRDWVMIDAGANIGYFSILFSQLAPDGRIFAFEPTDTIEMLRQNLVANNCKNVTPFKIALSDKKGKREDSIFRLWGLDAEKKRYAFSTIDDMVDSLSLNRLDCIKIDVDSYEFEVLRGAEQTLERFNPWLIVELTDAISLRGQGIVQAIEWLVLHGYHHAILRDGNNFCMKRDTSTISSNRTMTLEFDAPYINP